jgi:DNA-directed RNA polymerase sigma subunit (sigma70/sigma32)
MNIGHTPGEVGKQFLLARARVRRIEGQGAAQARACAAIAEVLELFG